MMERLAIHLMNYRRLHTTEYMVFKTVDFRIKVQINDDGTWGYDEDTVLMIKGQTEPFHHTDRNLLHKVAEPTPNPLMR